MSALDVTVTAAVEGDPQAVGRVLAAIRPLVVRYCRARVGRQERSFASADDVAQEVCLAILTALPSYRDQGRPFLAFVYGIAAHKVADAHRAAARNRSEPVAVIPDIPAAGPTPEELALIADERRRTGLRNTHLGIHAIRGLVDRTSLGAPTAIESRRRSAGHTLDSRAATIVDAVLRDTGMSHYSAATYDVEPGTPNAEERAMQGELTRRMKQLLDVLPDKMREIVILRVVVGLSAEETAEAVGSTPGAVRVAQHRALTRLRRTLSTAEFTSHG
jgi:RNA polymerase sigma factor (sigma-70 family)